MFNSKMNRNSIFDMYERHKVLFYSLLIALMQGAGVSCAEKIMDTDKRSILPNSQVADMAGAQKYVSLDFGEGTSALSESSQSKLRSLVTEIPKNKIDEVLVLAWADREYPSPGTKATTQDIDLADKRAKAVTDYLADNLRFKVDIDKHNMAKRPETLSSLLKTEDYTVKRNLENTGVIPKDEPIVLNRKASTALVLVKYNN